MATTITRNRTIFSDLDISFGRNPVTGDVNTLTNEESIKQAVKLLVLTQNYERPFHSEIGSPVGGLLFENSSPLLSNIIKRVIRQAIANFEPRVRVNDIGVIENYDNNGIIVTVQFSIVGTTTTYSVDINLERTR
jgi:phage baseplate assembly protein W